MTTIFAHHIYAANAGDEFRLGFILYVHYVALYIDYYSCFYLIFLRRIQM